MATVDEDLKRLREELLLAESENRGYAQALAAANAREAALARFMHDIATAVVPRELDALARDGDQPRDAAELAGLILTALPPRLARLEAMASGRVAEPDTALREQLTAAQARIRELEERLEKMTPAAVAARDDAVRAQSQVAALQRRLDTAEADCDRARRELEQARAAESGPAESAVEPVAAPPDDPQTARLRDLVEVLATQAECRWPLLSPALADRWGIQASSGTLWRVLQEAADLQLVEILKPANETGRGSAVQLVRLTEAGRQRAREWCGREPAEPELDRLLARHKSPEHVLLNLLAADMFRAAGYQVDLLPDPRPIAGDTFAPDLCLVDPATNAVHYIECERRTRKEPLERDRKWEVVTTATGGTINLVTPNSRAMDAVVSEINHWSSRRQRPITLRAGHLTAMRPDRLWKVERLASRP